MWVVLIADTDKENRSDQIIRQGPVGNGLGNKLGIGNDDILIVPGGQHQRSQADTGDNPLAFTDTHPVFNPDRPFGQQDQAADQVVGNILQTKTNTDTKGPGKTVRLVRLMPIKFRDTRAPITKIAYWVKTDRLLRRPRSLIFLYNQA